MRVDERPPVDVIVPLYDGTDRVTACVDSLLANTPGNDIRIVLADDASPDPAIPRLLESFRRRDPRVVVQRREANVGFPENCNMAMAWSENDVVLVNSDTIVPPGWLDRMRALAATSDRIGSITPLTSNGEICGVPIWLADNSYPEELTVDELDDIAATVGSGDWVEIPTGVGFCLYLTRRGLDAVGFFDSATFGRGYGEENDLCLRLRNNGFLNLLCDTVFVFHAGSGSFGSSTDQRIRQNLERLNHLWPGYEKVIGGFIRESPLAGVQGRFGLEMLRRIRPGDTLRVLYLLHHPIWSHGFGGTELHVADLVSSLGAQFDPLVLSRRGELPHLQWPQGLGPSAFPLAAPSHSDPAWVNALLSVGIDVIHIHHTKGLSVGELQRLHDTANGRGIPVIHSLHDYYPLCPGVQLLDAASREPCRSIDGAGPCKGCEQAAEAAIGGGVAEWRNVHERLLRQSILVAPSRAAVATYTLLWPWVEDQVRVLPHGTDLRWDRPPEAAEGDDVRPVRLGVLTYGANHKGDEMIGRLVEALAANGYEWHVYGRDSWPALESLPEVTLHGHYERDTIVGRLRDDDISAVVMLPTWDETFSFTLSEAWAAGLFVFAPDRGAVGDRIRESGAGVLVDASSITAVAQDIRSTLASSERARDLRAAARRAGAALRTLSDMTAEYADLYRALAPELRPADATLRYPWSNEELGRLVGTFRSPLPSVDLESRPSR